MSAFRSHFAISARSKTGYLFVRFGWADLLASLPLPELKLFRLFRLVRVTSLLRAYGTRNTIRSLVRDRAESALLTLVLLGTLVLGFGSLEIPTSRSTSQAPTSRPAPTRSGTSS